MLEKSLHHFFTNSLSKYADNTAVVSSSMVLSYKELDELTNQLANQMLKNGVQAGEIVALYLKDGLMQIAAIIAVMKIGATYFPIHPDTPVDRIKKMQGETSSRFMVSDMTDVSLPTFQVLSSSDHSAYLSKAPEMPVLQPSPAYVMFTSGSTGVPKGVLMQHAGPINTVLSMDDLCGITEEDAIIQNVSISFDPSVWLIFWPLRYGARIIVPDSLTDVMHLCDLAKDNQVRVLHAGPTLFSAIAQHGVPTELSSLRFIIGGGQAWQLNQLKTLSALFPDCSFCNVYGPTEASIHATAWTVSADELMSVNQVLIGRPIRNMQVYILNSALEPVAYGEVGEAYLSGVGLADGYINQLEMDESPFIDSSTFGRLYRTGDLVNFTTDGAINFIGRADEQVQVRGYRVELAEIEKSINSVPLVSVGLVVADKRDKSHVKIRVFIMSSPKDAQEVSALVRAALAEKLPSYMHPSSYTVISEIPLTPHAKPDKAALLALYDKVEESKPLVTTHTEKSMESIWAVILKSPVNEDDNFFELGGDSLDALQLVAKLNDEYKTSFSVVDIFECPTVKLLSEKVECLSHAKNLNNAQANEGRLVSDIPFSANQHWLLAMAKGSRTINNIVIPLRITGSICYEVLKDSFYEIVNLHDILRSRADLSLTKTMSVRTKIEGLYTEKDISSLYVESQDQYIDDLTSKLNSQEIDLEQSFLFQVHAVKLSEGSCVVVLFMHHLVSDPSSVTIILSHMSEFFCSQSLSAASKKIVQFSQYALSEKSNHAQQAYLARVKEEAVSLSTLTHWVNYGSVSESDRSAGFFKVKMEQDLSNQVIDYAHDQKTTLFNVFLSVFSVTLHRVYRQPVFSVGVNVSHRDSEQYAHMIGPLSEQALIPFDFREKYSCQFLHKKIRAHMARFFDEGSPSLWDIYQWLFDEGQMSSPDQLFNTLFDYEPRSPEVEFVECTVERMAVKPSESIRRHLTFRVAESEEGFEFQVRYRQSLFSESAIVKLVEAMILSIQEMTGSVSKKTEEVTYG